MPHPAEAFFTDLHASLGVGVPETSGYLALANLLNAVGDSLKPKITAVIPFSAPKKDPDLPLHYAVWSKYRKWSFPKP